MRLPLMRGVTVGAGAPLPAGRVGTCWLAAASGHPPGGVAADFEAMTARATSAAGGHLGEVLRWMREHDCTLDGWTSPEGCGGRALGSGLEVSLWAVGSTTDSGTT